MHILQRYCLSPVMMGVPMHDRRDRHGCEQWVQGSRRRNPSRHSRRRQSAGGCAVTVGQFVYAKQQPGEVSYVDKSGRRVARFSKPAH